MCDAMKWNHLPNAGGLYDQHPKLLDQWRIIFDARSEHEARERDRNQKPKPNIRN